MVAAAYPLAVLTLATCQTINWRGAQQAGCRSQRKTLLADVRHAMYQPGVGEAFTLRQPGGCQVVLPGQKFGECAHVRVPYVMPMRRSGGRAAPAVSHACRRWGLWRRSRKTAPVRRRHASGMQRGCV